LTFNAKKTIFEYSHLVIMNKFILLFILAPYLLVCQPTFTVTDSNGNLWDSESLLEDGKTIIVTFFSPSETCWPSASHITKLGEAYNAYYSCNDVFFVQVAQWGSEYQTISFVQQFGNPNVPTIVGYPQGQTLTMDWIDWGLLYSYETWLLRPDGSYEVDIPYAWDLDQQVLIDVLETDGFIDCGHSMSIQEPYRGKHMVKRIDIWGRETANKGFQLVIYDDGSVEKKYILQ